MLPKSLLRRRPELIILRSLKDRTRPCFYSKRQARSSSVEVLLPLIVFQARLNSFKDILRNSVTYRPRHEPELRPLMIPGSAQGMLQISNETFYATVCTCHETDLKLRYMSGTIMELERSEPSQHETVKALRVWCILFALLGRALFPEARRN
jgi:hypothetical protein